MHPKIQKGDVSEEKDKFSWKQSYTHKNTYRPHYKIYLLFKAARWKITGKVLDKTKQQLISISAIQFVFSFKPLISTYFDAHFLPAHHHFKGELRQAPPNLHSEEVYLIATQNQSISKQFPNFQLRLLSLKWYSKASCACIFPALLHCPSRSRAHILLASPPAFQFCTPGKSMHFNYPHLRHRLPSRQHTQSSAHPFNCAPFGSQAQRCRWKAGIPSVLWRAKVNWLQQWAMEQQRGTRLSWNPQSTHRHFSKNWKLSLVCPHHT